MHAFWGISLIKYGKLPAVGIFTIKHWKQGQEGGIGILAFLEIKWQSPFSCGLSIHADV